MTVSDLTQEIKSHFPDLPDEKIAELTRHLISLRAQKRFAAEDAAVGFEIFYAENRERFDSVFSPPPENEKLNTENFKFVPHKTTIIPDWQTGVIDYGVEYSKESIRILEQNGVALPARTE